MEERKSGARSCDSCRLAASLVYCQADSAYLCASCDGRVHEANKVASRHDRVWVCEACKSAPASVTCNADAAALCAACDAVIHSANPLARRHHRVPIVPITGHLFGPPAANLGSRSMMVGQDEKKEDGHDARKEEEEEEEEVTSWLLLNGVKKSSKESNEYGYGGEVEYLDLEDDNGNYSNNSRGENQYHNQQQQQQKDGGNEGSEGVVPVQCMGENEQLLDNYHQQQRKHQNVQLEFEVSNAAFSYTTSHSTMCCVDKCSASICFNLLHANLLRRAFLHQASLSCLEASLVPDTAMADISNLHIHPHKGTIDLFSGNPIQMAPQFTSIDREARVLRYREKRKTRKFEKTIRYASRKAYAEMRPRIKGRFAKREEIEVEVDQLFSSTVIEESGYGIVPSF